MNNYEYIIACLPVIERDSAGLDTDAIIDGIRELLDGRDRGVLDFMLKGYDPDSLGADFYRSALSHRNRFIREFFGFDLDMRNAKVRYLNRELGRDPEKDIVLTGETEREFDGREQADAVLSGTDILERERGLDAMAWDRIEEINRMELFSLDAILGFVARLKIVDRWIKLDPETGKAMFRKLVEDIRNNR